MDDWPVTILDASATVETVSGPPPPDAPTMAEVDRIWAEATAANPSLFNGRVFSALLIERGRIAGHWTEYRLALAQMRHPALTPVLRIRPLAVNGVLRCAGGFVLGRRNASAVYQAGLWQCPPAGSVESRHGCDHVDLASQLAAELEEELGRDAAACEIGGPLATVGHPRSRIVDVGIALRTTLDFEAIRARHARSGNAEYDTLALVAADAVESWIAAGRAQVAPPPPRFYGRASVRPRTAPRSPR